MLWDDALDTAASADLVPSSGISCDLSLKAGLELSGSLTQDIDPTTAKVTFDDLKVGDVSDNHQFVLACQEKPVQTRAAIQSRSLDTTGIESDPVVVYDWPEMAMQRRSTLGLTYEGPADIVNATINAFNNLMVEGSDIVVEQLPTDSTGDGMVIDQETLAKFASEQTGHPYCFAGVTCQLWNDHWAITTMDFHSAWKKN